MAHNPDDIEAIERVLDSWGIRKQREDIAANILGAVSDRIATRERQRTLAEVSQGVRIFDPMLADRIEQIAAQERAAAEETPNGGVEHGHDS